MFSWNWEWIVNTRPSILMIFVTGLGIYCLLMICVRLAGLRSFAKMSSFDFATTVAMGSVMAATLLAKEPPLLHGAMGLMTLFAIQFIVSWLRRHTSFMSDLVDNEPMLLMDGPNILQKNLARVRLTTEDLNGHLRQAGIINPQQVLAVIMETTGDISVLQINDSYELDLGLLADVREAEDNMLQSRSATA